MHIFNYIVHMYIDFFESNKSCLCSSICRISLLGEFCFNFLVNFLQHSIVISFFCSNSLHFVFVVSLLLVVDRISTQILENTSRLKIFNVGSAELLSMVVVCSLFLWGRVPCWLLVHLKFKYLCTPFNSI